MTALIRKTRAIKRKFHGTHRKRMLLFRWVSPLRCNCRIRSTRVRMMKRLSSTSTVPYKPNSNQSRSLSTLSSYPETRVSTSKNKTKMMGSRPSEHYSKYRLRRELCFRRSYRRSEVRKTWVRVGGLDSLRWVRRQRSRSMQWSIRNSCDPLAEFRQSNPRSPGSRSTQNAAQAR